MENETTGAKRDILTEGYKGTGPVVSAIGYGAIETKVVWLLGLLTGGAIGFAAPDKVNHMANLTKTHARRVIDNNPEGFFGAIKRGYGHVIEKTFKAADWCVEHTMGKPEEIQAKYSRYGTRVQAAITAGGVLSLAGIVISLVTGSAHGVKSATDGKDQFEHAKKEIKTLRDEKEALTTELEKTSKELAKTKAEVTKFAAENDVTPKAIISNAEHAETVMPKSHHHHHGHHA